MSRWLLGSGLRRWVEFITPAIVQQVGLLLDQDTETMDGEPGFLGQNDIASPAFIRHNKAWKHRYHHHWIDGRKDKTTEKKNKKSCTGWREERVPTNNLTTIFSEKTRLQSGRYRGPFERTDICRPLRLPVTWRYEEHRTKTKLLR